MKKFSKFLSIVLAVAMLATLAPTFVFANESNEPADGKITLVDFGAVNQAPNYILRGDDHEYSAFAAEGKSASLKYTANIVFDEETNKYRQDDEALDIYYDEINLKEYADDNATINIKFYTEAEGSKFNFVFLGSENTTRIDITPDDGENNAVSTYNQKQYAVEKGWQLYSVKLKDAIGKFAYYDKDNIINIRLVANAWGNLDATTGKAGYKDGDEIFIDEIFIDTNPDSYYDEIEANGGKLLWKSEIGFSGANATKKYDANHGEFTRFSSKSTTMTFAQSFTTDSDGYRHYKSIFNTSDYKWLNLWMYSPYAQDDGMNILLYTNRKTGKFKEEIINDKKVQMGIYVDEVQQTYVNAYPIHHKQNQVDWKGWKLISIPVSGNNKIIGLDINVGGWIDNGFTNIPSANDLIFGIDGIWMSSEETSPQSQWEATRTNNTTPIAKAENDIIVNEYSTAESVKLKSGSKASDGRFSKVSLTYDNPFLYDIAARANFGSATYDDLYSVAANNADSKMPSYCKVDLDVYGNSSNKTDIIKGLNDNSHLNVWIYNPEPKYQWTGNDYAEIPLILCYYDGSATKRCVVRIIANFTGWKLISVPLKSVNANLVSKGINYIYFALNGGWFNVKKKTSDSVQPTVNSYSHTTNELNRGWIANGNVNVVAMPYVDGIDKDGNAIKVNQNRNDYNYIDVSRVWISDGMPDVEFNMTVSDNSELLCLGEGVESINLYETEEKMGVAQFKGVKFTKENGIEVFEPAVENGTLIIDGQLEYGAQYNVYAEMINIAGIKVTDDFSFKAEEFHVSEMTVSEDGKTATVKMHGIIPADYENAVIVAAVYSEAEGVTKLESVNKAQYDEELGEITAVVDSIPEGQSVKFMFLSGMDTLKPLSGNIRE